MGKLKDEYKPGDEDYYNSRLSKIIWANYSVAEEVMRSGKFKVNIDPRDYVDKEDYKDVFNLR